MEKAAKLSKLNQVELRIYRCLGVKHFKRAVLAFERIRHRNDGGHNENYHPKDTSLSAWRCFPGYLLYNGLLHAASLLLAVGYFVAARMLEVDLWAADAGMCIVAVCNLYCMMLQRYHYLRIKAYVGKALEKRAVRAQQCVEKLAALLEQKAQRERAEEYELLRIIRHSATTGHDCVLSGEDLAALNRLAAVAACLAPADGGRTPGVMECKSLGAVLSAGKGKTHVVGRTERRTAKLQRALGLREERNVMFGYCIVTQDGECEAAYRKLFPDRTRDGVEWILTVLFLAYQQQERGAGR